MKHLYASLLSVSLIAAVLVNQGCGSESVTTTGGSGTEAPNAVVVISENGILHGTALRGARVGVYAVDYVPYNDSGFSMVKEADASGEFRFDGLEPGKYNVTADDGKGNRAVFLSNVPVGEAGGVKIARGEMTAMLVVKGVISKSTELAGLAVPVYLEGTPYYDLTDTAGRFRMLIPAGQYRFLSQSVPGSLGGQDFFRIDMVVAVYTDDYDLGSLLLDSDKAY